MFDFASVLPKSILISSFAILKTWIELVHSARQAGLSVRAKAMQLWQVGAGLPLDALKKGTIVEWACPYKLDVAEIAPLLDALGKNGSLIHLDLTGSGLSWVGASATGGPLVEKMSKSSAVLARLQILIISADSGYRIPVGQLRAGHDAALAALLAAPFFGLEPSLSESFSAAKGRTHGGGPRRDEILFIGDLLRKNSGAGSGSGAAGAGVGEADAVAKLLAAARRGKVERSAWEQQLARLLVGGNLRRGQLQSLLTAECLRDVGFKADKLLAVGFTLGKLRAGGFTAAELKKIGTKAATLRAEGFSARELREAAFTAKEMKTAEVPIRELHDGGYLAKALRAVGYEPLELTQGG